MNNRRDFLKQIVLTATAITVPSVAFSATEKKKKKGKKNEIKLGKNAIILFQGDSITDAGRDKNLQTANNVRALGSGYAMLAASELLLEYPENNLTIYNKGISGNKVYQLRDRWSADTIALKPDVLSILVGVNDYWHTLTHNYKGTVETYENDLRQLLVETRKVLPNVKFIIGEPFAVKDVKAVTDEWFPTFDGYRMVARKLATEFDAVFIPYQKIFDEAIRHAPAAYWTGDGVHPSLAGAALMAEAWMEAIK